MTFNSIQFQQGMSVTEFLGRFGTEGQCALALRAARWPNGFVCPKVSFMSLDQSRVLHCLV